MGILESPVGLGHYLVQTQSFLFLSNQRLLNFQSCLSFSEANCGASLASFSKLSFGKISLWTMTEVWLLLVLWTAAGLAEISASWFLLASRESSSECPGILIIAKLTGKNIAVTVMALRQGVYPCDSGSSCCGLMVIPCFGVSSPRAFPSFSYKTRKKGNLIIGMPKGRWLHQTLKALKAVPSSSSHKIVSGLLIV